MYSYNTLYLSNEHFCVYIASSKHEEGWENLRLSVMQTQDLKVCITFENSPNPLSVKMRLCKHDKRLCKHAKSALLLL